MLNVNTYFMLDVMFILCSLYCGYYIMRYRSKGEAILKNYKPGTPEYEAYRKGFSNWWPAGVAVALLLLGVKAWFDVRTLQRIDGDRFIGHIAFLTGFVVVLFTIVVLAVRDGVKRKKQ